jgi:hypothetical protein
LSGEGRTILKPAAQAYLLLKWQRVAF